MKTVFIPFLALIAVSTAALAADVSDRAGRASCKADVEKLCANVERGEGRIVQCLKENEAKLSTPCKAAVAQAQAQGKAAAAPAAPPQKSAPSPKK
jgi:cysteine rich repeat protein